MCKMSLLLYLHVIQFASVEYSIMLTLCDTVIAKHNSPELFLAEILHSRLSPFYKPLSDLTHQFLLQRFVILPSHNLCVWITSCHQQAEVHLKLET